MKYHRKGKNIELSLEIDWGRHVEQKIDTDQLQTELQKVIDQKIVPLLDKGLSPVKSQRMFRKYKNPDRYPADLKQNNKPNLRLTGEMLYWYYAMKGFPERLVFYLGIKDDAPKEVRVRAKANNEGTEKDGKGIPARRFIPLQGESYTREIVLAIRNAFAKVMADALKKKG